ncbi:MAG TPA: DUF1980 domain-containing protein [bacterium]|nr:DUF1980 domain-containing protein [bacterium]HPP87175.1 DUF1980 domain-containing protein [bacterium]
MNVIKFISLLILNISISSVYFSNKLVKYIHPKYNVYVLTAIIITGLLLILIFAALFKNRKYVFKFDFGVILLFPAFLLIFDKPMLQTSKLVDTKFKGTVNFKQFEESKKSFGVRKKELLSDLQLNQDSETYKKLNIIEIYNLFNLLKSKKEIEKFEMKIETIGQLYRQYGKDSIDLYENEFMIIRLIMICCAADMMPLGIIVENKQKYDYNRYDDWLKIRGKLTFIANPKGKGYIAYIEDDYIEKIEAPDPEWLYPSFP